MPCPAPLILRLGECVVTVDDGRREVLTTFPDGSSLLATDDPAPEHLARARDLGYADTWGMNRHHDIMHSFLAAREGRPYSVTLWHACHADSPIGADPDERQREECRVLAFQRFVTSGDDRWNCVFWLGRSYDLDDLARDFRALLGG